MVPLRILIVERDQLRRDSLTACLRTLGHEPTPVSDYGKALILLSPGQFDLMLVSCAASDLDDFGSTDLLTVTRGLALAQIGRSDDPKLKIILGVTSRQEGFEAEHSKGVVDLIIAQPFNIEVLEKALSALF
jgi:CheY-like chemotaxis protein